MNGIAIARPKAAWPLRFCLGAAALVVIGLVLALSEDHDGFKPLYVISGAFVGLLVGLTGVGGGSLMTPVLILVFGFHPASAVGTDLLYASATKTFGTGVHAANHTVDWRLVARLATGSVPATLLTVVAVNIFHLNSGAFSHVLSIILGIMLLITAATLLLRNRLARLARDRSPELSFDAANGLTVLLGAILGVMITLTSVGAGALGVTALVFLYPRMPLPRIVGSDIVHAVPLTLIAGAAHWWMGSVDTRLLMSLLCGSIPGVIVGSLLTPRLTDSLLRPVIACVLLAVAVKLLT